MSGPWSLSMAFGSIEAEIWSTMPFGAVGLLQPQPDGRLRFEIRTPLTAAATSFHAAALETGGTINRVLGMWGLATLHRVPIGDDGWQLFAARPATQPFGDEDLARMTQLAARIVAVSRAGEPADARERRLTRIDALSGVLRTLSSALDVRDVFAPLSELASRVLPHDSAVIGILEGASRVRLHALNAPSDWKLPEVIDTPYPVPFSDGLDFVIHRDLPAHPLERTMPAASVGLRSALRVPLSIDGQVAGVLDFSTFEPDRYVDADVPIARRMAEYVSLALTHERMAEHAREATAARERSANLEMLDGLLETLAGSLDVREVFDRVSEVSVKVMTHDAMSISIPTEDGLRWIIHVATGYLSDLVTPFEMDAPTPRLLDSYWDFELVADMREHRKYDGTPSVNAGMRALLSIPVWVENRLRATVNFYSRAPQHFTTDDVLIGRRIADHIALALSHQRLAEESRRRIELQERAAKLQLIDELLASVTESGPLPDVFGRVSEAVRRALPHDALVMTSVQPGSRYATVYASQIHNGAPYPEVVPVPPLMQRNPDWDYEIVDDLQALPEQRSLEATRRGYRAALRVPIRLDNRYVAGVSCLSLTAGVYQMADVAVARRIADRLALSFARERGSAQARRADEAVARAAALEARVRELTEELDARTGYRRVVGVSQSWRHVLTQATQVAATDTTVLLLGESGTGKEVVARFLHRASARSDGPFLALNCAALPEQLLEAELFGYERGAYTGATHSKPGQLELAAGGTLFLDEVGEMSLPAQAKFLRVLQEREFQRLGGTRVLRTDARIVAATNRDLPRAIGQGTFREDLFYRLNVFAILLPALRDRADDILPLSEAFLAEIGRGLGRPPSGISKEARATLAEYHWPGNVRELRNLLERAAILCDGGLITPEHLALDVMPRRVVAAAAAVAVAAGPAVAAGDLKSMERSAIEQALHNARFNKSKAAKELGLTRAQLYVRMRRYGLE